MAGNVTLSSAVRDNLLSLQNTSKLINQTQGRLSTGLKVASPIDDPVAFFQAKALNDRASDFTAKKDSIDQGISTVTSALNSVTAVESLVKQLKGLALSAKSATTSAEISTVVTQFNDLKTQINKLADDATYQGLNLVAGSGQTLTISFSNDTASQLTVASKDITTGVSGLDVTDLAAVGTGNAYNYDSRLATDTISVGDTISFTVANSAGQTLSYGSHTISYGTFSVIFKVGSGAGLAAFDVASVGAEYVLSAGEVITFTIATVGASAAAGGAFMTTITSTDTTLNASANISASTKIGVGFSTTLNSLITDLETNLTTIRSVAKELGSNVAMLQTRIDFTKDYVNTLTAGAGKLNLADLNEEGANLLALQTRQQLGIQALSFAGQAEQGILGLFR